MSRNFEEDVTKYIQQCLNVSVLEQTISQDISNFESNLLQKANHISTHDIIKKRESYEIASCMFKV